MNRAVNQANQSPHLVCLSGNLIACQALAYMALLAAAATVFYRAMLADLTWVHVGVLYADPYLRILYLSALALLSCKAWLWWRYKPCPLVAWHGAPTLTVVIPAFNEGAMVEKTIDSIAAARYPPEKLQIVVVDDGSRDNTWVYICRAAARHGSRVQAVHFANNRGKRAALMEGILRATGEILVTIDSDSIIDYTTLLAIVAPFRDPQVGVVAGKVMVHNVTEGLIPRMLQFVFALSFDFQRAAESQFRTVYCSPGALAAYRSTGLRQVCDSWIAQSFLGSPCTFGEDRALTNYLLARGYDSVYQSNAVVRTLVPTRYAQLCKMFLRWDRSFVREELRLAGIVWTRPVRYCLMVLWDKITMDFCYPLPFAVFVALPVLLTEHPALLILLPMGIALGSLPFVLLYYSQERSWQVLYGFVYAYFSVFALSWIFPYALFTARARSWLTR